MNDLHVGQILWLKIRFNNFGNVSAIEHPYLIVDIADGEIKTVEVGQMDSLKPYKLAYLSNKPIYVTDPMETVLEKDSYIQLDNKITLEYFEELLKCRRTTDTLSEKRLQEILKAYHTYHETHIIEDAKIVYMSKEEIIKLNPGL